MAMIIIFLLSMSSMGTLAAPSSAQKDLEFSTEDSNTVMENLMLALKKSEDLENIFIEMNNRLSNLSEIESAYLDSNVNFYRLSQIVIKMKIQQENEIQSTNVLYYYLECLTIGIIFGIFIGTVCGLISITFARAGIDRQSKTWKLTFGSIMVFSLFCVYCIVTYLCKRHFSHFY